MKIILITLALLPITALACPTGMESCHYAGSKACYQDGVLMQIEGSLNNCPAGFMRSSDQWGIGVCSDGNITAYENCLAPFIESVDQYGQPVCLDIQNKPIIQMIPAIL